MSEKTKNNKSDLEKKESSRWIKKAEADLRKAKILFSAKEYDGALFYSQQVAEKGLKAVHIFIGQGLTKTHELGALARRVNAPKKIQEKGIILTPYERFSRYPDLNEEFFDKDNSIEALKITQEVLAWCKQQIKI